MSVTLYSPAKINLFLHIVGKRPDGYHELASLFQAIDLCDILHVSLDQEDSLTTTDPTLPVDNTNLVTKAVRLFRKKTGIRFGAKIHLEKHIPTQAGLGGGSGNAATTLYALNTLLGSPASEEDLREWAAEIGSDISFFFSSGTAYCTGRGEKVQSLPPVALPLSSPLWIFKPAYGLSTPHVYKNLNLSQRVPRNPSVALEEWIQGKGAFFNDLESAACVVEPRMLALKLQIEQQAFLGITLCGSGSAWFGFGSGPFGGASREERGGISVFSVAPMARVMGGWFDRG